MATETIKKIIPTSGDGYCKMPDGTLIQWGSFSKTTVANTTVTHTVTFDTPFKNNNITVFVNQLTSATGLKSAVNGFTNTACDICIFENTASTRYFNWLAIGRWK